MCSSGKRREVETFVSRKQQTVETKNKKADFYSYHLILVEILKNLGFYSNQLQKVVKIQTSNFGLLKWEKYDLKQNVNV